MNKALIFWFFFIKKKEQEEPKPSLYAAAKRKQTTFTKHSGLCNLLYSQKCNVRFLAAKVSYLSAMAKKAIYFLLLFPIVLLYLDCFKGTEAFDVSRYANLHDSVQYVGMNTCKSCHFNVYETFIQTGMGQSFDTAGRHKSAARFDAHTLVYDEESDFYYYPSFQGNDLFITEFRLQGKDTIHKRVEKVDYIIGSGQHTNSHLVSQNGYLFQAPITYYTQKGQWDLAPGFEKENLRFDRILTTECITCHNDYPTLVDGSLHKYALMPNGIACERCHGPGEIHVKEKLAGNIIDTSRYIDYTIVNPRDLPKDLQMDVCQRCHLQGLAVLQQGKSFYDFKP
ncbi:MAG TPA: hypothetical protein ENJ45_01995, partial [Phaeodactylibacter sp.]|nr:hypothetical protein [Phaeodactylibacter sp.]